MNLNPGRDATTLDQDAESSPIRSRGYVNPALRSSPPAQHNSEAGSYLFRSATVAAEPVNQTSHKDYEEGDDEDDDGRTQSRQGKAQR